MLHSAVLCAAVPLRGSQVCGTRILPGIELGSNGCWALDYRRLGPGRAARTEQAETDGCHRQQQCGLQGESEAE